MTPRATIVIRFTAAAVLLLAAGTLLAQRTLPERLVPQADTARRYAVLARGGEALTASYQERWNYDDQLPLERVPAFLRTAMVEAEDRRFWSHPGIDGRARLGAIWQDLRAGRAVRGASTISEQAVRLLHPRPRTLWSRWVEGFEALRLEARFGKAEILEFYLNQVPYGANRRGVVQAARYYFGRELATLSDSEMLALAVLPRAPSRLDPRQFPERLAGPMQRLVARLREDGLIAEAQVAAMSQRPASPRAKDDDVPATYYIAELRRRADALFPGATPASLRGSLEAVLQAEAQALLDNRVAELKGAGVRQGGLMVVDLQGNKVRAWAVSNLDAAERGQGIDTVLTARQPGSALKPFVYALALESGWTAATRIEDDAIAAHVGGGLHPCRNYSRLHYGTVTLREALGNSLNIPAIKALQFVGGERLLGTLRALGMSGLTAHPDWYGDGIALGNGEVTLLQLVQAYAALANQGRAQPVTLFEEPVEHFAPALVLNREAALIITDILSDPGARRLEFGNGGLLRFSAQTAVKTGTSSDYRDAWCVAFNQRYVVGAWMGNLGGAAMDGVTGSIGPALLVRSVFGVLNRGTETRPLYRSPALVARAVVDADGGQRSEWFAPDAAGEVPAATALIDSARPMLLQPFEGLHVAFDPRVPAALQALEFQLAPAVPDASVVWYVDEVRVAETGAPRYLWPLVRGEHRARAEALDGGWSTPTVRFRVK